MGATRVRFLLELWRRSSANLPPAPFPEPEAKAKDRSPWMLPRPILPPKSMPPPSDLRRPE